MSMSGTQKGYLRKRNLTRPSTLSDNVLAEIEYEDAKTTWIPRGARPGVVIVNVRALNGRSTDDGEYLFRVMDDGFFRREAELVLTKDDGRWRQIIS